MASSSEQLEKLITMRTGWNYTPKTAEQIRAQAEGEYQSYYDQLRLAAQQAQAQSDLRLAQQASSLQAAYDEQRENSMRQYRRTYSQADRQLLARGMQRSSYGNSTLANIDIESARAQDKINQAQISAQSQIEEQRTQLQQQLAQQMSQYTASQQADVMKRSRELEDIEYNRQVDAWKSQMSMEQMIYEAARQQERDTIADQQYQEQMAHQRERDTIADQQYQEQMARQRERDTIADQQYQEQMARQKERDAVADQQWQAQMDENRRQFDETMEYNYSKKSGGGGGGSKATTTPATGALPQNTPGTTGQVQDFNSTMQKLNNWFLSGTGAGAGAGAGAGSGKLSIQPGAIQGAIKPKNTTQAKTTIDYSKYKKVSNSSKYAGNTTVYNLTNGR